VFAAPRTGRRWAEELKREEELVRVARTIIQAAPLPRYSRQDELADIHKLIQNLRGFKET
jgi:hypothetical protein